MATASVSTSMVTGAPTVPDTMRGQLRRCHVDQRRARIPKGSACCRADDVGGCQFGHDLTSDPAAALAWPSVLVNGQADTSRPRRQAA